MVKNSSTKKENKFEIKAIKDDPRFSEKYAFMLKMIREAKSLRVSN